MKKFHWKVHKSSHDRISSLRCCSSSILCECISESMKVSTERLQRTSELHFSFSKILSPFTVVVLVQARVRDDDDDDCDDDDRSCIE